MIFDERTYSVLVVSGSDRFNELTAQVLPEASYSPIIYANGASVARRKLLDRSFDLIIINTPLQDEFGTGFAIDISNASGSVCLMVVKNEIFDEVYTKVVSHGVFVLSKPLNSFILSRSIKWLESAREKLRAAQKTTTSVEEKMEEIRMVNRAKWLLIEHENMTEDKAHHFIEKSAMDRSISKRSVAGEIITRYNASGS